MGRNGSDIISQTHIFRRVFSFYLFLALFITYSGTACAENVYETDISAIIREFHGEKLKYIGTIRDLVNYMYESFLIGRGVVVAYTGEEKITLTDIEDYVEQVIRRDKPGLGDCEALWGNIDGYNKAVSYMEGYTLVCICPVFRHTQKEIKRLDMCLDEIVEGWKDKSSMNREEKTKLVHDYIVDNFDYDVSLKNYDEYNAFFSNGQSQSRVMVCQGYALLTYRLLNRLDVPCKIVLSETHSWNIVQLEDGLWYHLDCTNDDLGVYGKENTYDCFLKPELSGDLYHYKIPCALYEDLSGFSFGTRKYSKTETLYILERIIIRRDLNYLTARLALMDIEIWAGLIFTGNVILYLAVRKKLLSDKIKKERKFVQYNDLLL